MSNSVPRSGLARFAFAVLCLFWTGSAWYFLLHGSVTHSYRHSPHKTVITGPGFLAVCFIFFALGAIAASVVLQSWAAPRWCHAVSAAILIGLPAVYAFML
jgi:uncharacterized BrkB/YihY/UPF0761 family membrane protein